MSSSNLLRIVRNRKSCCNLPCGTFTIGPKYRRHAADLFGPRTNKVPLKSASRAASTSHAFAAARSRLLSPFPSIVSVGYRRHRYDSSTVVTNYYRNFSSAVKANIKMPRATKPFQRLPKNVKPQHYALNLVPDLKSLTFKGDVSVKIEVLESTDEIILNALELNIESVQVKGDKIFIPKEIQVIQSDETVHFKFDTHIAPGVYTLDVVFNGEINNKMRGLYRSKYINEKGEECYAAVTQFESTDARRCFPCWDEPAVKATFDITLVVPKDRVALSNMPVKSQEPDGEDVVKYTFETTPIMSTYLVAAVIGEYDYVEGKSSDGVLVRVYTPKGKKDQGLFALDVATKVLPYYKEYFNIAYPLPKIDLIAIADFMAGAMENWGLVTYRETALLVDPQNTSAVSKQWIALVVGHELAHQWFGNLVTMEWWTHLWLNEGYASFVEFLCVNYLFPEYDIWTQFVNDSYIKALELDSLNNSHPIEVPVGNPSEIDEIFDDISYNKGASVIRMLHHYIGDEDFRKGMHNYLTKHQYKNTFTEDLWEALEDASKKPVGEVMSTWTKQMGFPLVSVTSKRATDGKGVHLTLTQSKFTADGSPAPETYKWMIPISISTSKNPSKEVISTVLKEKQTEIFVPDVTETDWIKVNPGTIGFYRTKYPPEMLEKFVPAIKDKSLPPLDRLGLVDDLFAMVKAGHTNTVEVLKFLRAFEDETDYNVWSSISNILSKLSQLLGCLGPIKEGYDKYQKQLLSKVNKRLGWNSNKGETHLDTLLRSLVLGRMALLNDDKTIEEARARLEKHIDGTEVLSADLRSACYKTVLRAGGQKEFETLLKLYRTTDLHEEKDRISRSMGAASELETLKKVLDFAMSDEVRSQDKAFVIIATSLHSIGRELSWEFFKDNWTTMHEQFKGSLMTRLVKYLTENFTCEEKAKEVEAFFQEHSVPGSERTVQQSVESIRLNAKWLSRDEIAIQKYLSSF
ncbi:puromycin-sensitive aminopeptidase [Anthonomus grandis grandis]|uniref:puromycin-sensitive aminopeptidase n=1 Tax=Anthonomus grandis grandis TaxID=2921223 RepID=UPI002165EB06|nr:puromycin-sensitive aminopeptidase [Anthonomus grandis grandis]